VKLNDGNWHFLLVTFSQNTTGQNELSLYVDQLENEPKVVSTAAASTTPGDCQLPGQLGFLDFGSWCIWNQCLNGAQTEFPLWGDPTGGGGASGLVAAWDFSNGSLTDVSGNHCPIVSTNGTLNWNIPALYNSGSGGAQPNAKDALNPGGNGAFSVTLWAYSGTGNVTYQSGTLLINEGNTGYNVFRISNYASTCTATFEQPLGTVKSQVSSVGHALPPGAWFHIAVTYDGSSTLTLYVNGVQTDQNTSAEPLTIANPSVFISSDANDHGFEGYIQGLAIWTTCLDAADVVTYMASDPSGQTGCAGFFPFVADMSNVVTGQPCTSGGGTSISTLLLPVASASAPPVPPGNTSESAASIATAATTDVISMTHPEIIAAAAKIGIDTTSPPNDSTEASPLSAEDIAQIKTLLASLPVAQVQALISQFQLHYAIGVRLAKNGTPMGSFTHEIQGSKAVFSYHTAAGPQNIGTIDVTDINGVSSACILNVTCAALGVIFAAFGVRYSASKLFKVLSTYVAGSACFVSAFYTMFGSDKPTMTEMIKGFVSALVCLGGSVVSLLWEVIWGSWWSFAITVLTVAGYIAGLIVSSGAILFIKLLMVGVAVAQFIATLVSPDCTGKKAAVAGA
jgi:Concanavalin A-like lectin/glucanases superfamily